MGKFQDYIRKATQPIVPAVQALQAQQQQMQQQQPQIDTSDAINSMAGLLGPTPAEREAQQQQLLKQKRNMIAWAGLFDGLRQLANLYTASRGANNMQFTDNPYQTIEQGYQAELKRQDANQHYANSYAKQMVDYNRQAESDQMKRDLQKAQLKWYDTRDEMARMKGENDRLRAEADIKLKEERKRNIKEKTDQLEALFPYTKKEKEARIKKLLHDAGRPYGSGRGKGYSSSSDDPFEELAELLIDRPDEIGPILQAEGFGFYDNESKKFEFTKNPSKGMVKTANRQVTRKGSNTGRIKVNW